MISRAETSTVKRALRKQRSFSVGDPSINGLIVKYSGAMSGSTAVASFGSQGTSVGVTQAPDGERLAYAFNGATTNGSAIETGIGANEAYSQVTAMAWIKPLAGATANSGAIWSKRSYFAVSWDDFPFTLEYNYISNRTFMALSVGNDFQHDLTLLTPPSPLGVWAHVCCSYTSNGPAKIYLNGVLAASGTVGTVSTSSRAWAIGRSPFQTNPSVDVKFNGYIADAALYSRQLSDAEVLAAFEGSR